MFCDAPRLRSDGVLTASEVRGCRATGVPLCYDPLQLGWVTLECEDDLSREDGRLRAVSSSKARTSALCLRRWASADVGVLRALLDDPLVWRHFPEPYPGPLSDSVAAELIEAAGLEGFHDVRAVESGGMVVGQVRLHFGQHGQDPTVAELSYWLGRAYWGRGLGKAAVSAAVQHAFATHPRLERLIARVHPDNHASAVLLRNAGFSATAPVDGWLWFVLPRI